MTRRRSIFLVGFMGSGKTTVGRALAERLGLDFLDLDAEIERRAGMSIREIFLAGGEAEFRRLETQNIAALEGLAPAVVALGGGAYVAEANRRILRRMGISVWLDCPLALCLARVGADQGRPLLADAESMRRLYESRRPAYAEAELCVAVLEDPPEAIADRLVRLLERVGLYTELRNELS